MRRLGPSARMAETAGRRGFRLGLAAGLAFAAFLAVPSARAEMQPATEAGDGVVRSSVRVLESAWSGMLDGASWMWGATSATFLPAPPSDYLPDQLDPRTRAFLDLMELAGYRLASLETGGMILSHASYRFVQERLLTTEDAERVRRGIAQHRGRHSGVSAAVHRWIAQSVLDATASKEYRVAAVDITMRPLPSLTFQVVALDRPLGDSERRLVQELRPPGNGGAAH